MRGIWLQTSVFEEACVASVDALFTGLWSTKFTYTTTLKTPTRKGIHKKKDIPIKKK